MAGPEKREHRRVPVKYEARVRLMGGEEFDAGVENLGAMGALLSTIDLDATMEVGDHVELRIAMGPRGEVRVPGEVVRVDQELDEAEIRRAFAVRFDVPIAH